MKLLKFFMFILYRFYKRRKLGSPYFRTISVVGALLALHVLQLLMLFNKMSLLLVRPGDDKKGLYFIIAGVLLTLIAISFIVKEKDLRNLEYDEHRIRRGGVYVTIYVILSLALFFLLALFGPRWSS